MHAVYFRQAYIQIKYYGGPFVSKFKCYIFIQIPNIHSRCIQYSFKTCNFHSSIQQYSFKIKRTRDLLLILANQCHVSGLGITLLGVEPHFLLIKTTTPCNKTTNIYHGHTHK